ncbi:MAG: chemotaxis protein CheW [Magnetospiraceae bacterium]
MNELVPASKQSTDIVAAQDESTYVTMFVADQMFGIPVLTVRDILIPEEIHRIPLAPNEVAGSINLRGRIVTVIDVRRSLGLPPQKSADPEPSESAEAPAAESKKKNGKAPPTRKIAGQERICVTAELRNELYSLQVDRIGDVLSLPRSQYEKNPATLNAKWREFSRGVYRLEGRLMIILDVEKLLDFTDRKAS